MAENSKGRSESVELEQVVKLEKEIEKPSKPLDLHVIRQKKPNSVMLTWKAPLYDGNDKINQYLIEQWSSDTKEWKLLATCDPMDINYVVNNLKDGCNYKFRVRASNKSGESEPSLETVDVKIQKNVTSPDVPEGPLKYTVNDDQSVINLEWSEPESNGGAKIKRYIVEKKFITCGGPLASTSEWFKVGFTSPDETKFKVADFYVEDCSFSIRIIAENEEGYKSAPLELHRPIVIERKLQKPEKPSYLRVKDKTSTSCTLVWKTFTVDQYTQAEKFIVEKRDKNSLEWQRVGFTKSETYTIEDLDSNSAYYFRVIAVNEAGESESAELSELISMDISNELPSMPMSISVDEVTQNSVTLSWISPKNSGSKPIIGYKIYQLASINTHWQEVGQVGKAKKLTFTAIDLDHHYDYRFKICAYSELGMGKFNETEKIQLKKPIGK